ncbi:hypothetical protein Q3G72_001093 [Acer saccharum]|nr:hypothetical protein Q3G72_001093 [Acer saccharum]
MELNGFSSLSSKMAMPSSSSSHHERFLSSSLFFSTRVGAGQSNISISDFSGTNVYKTRSRPQDCGLQHIYLVVEQGHDFFPLPEEELSQLVDIAEYRISIFGTSPGMDGSDENSIVKCTVESVKHIQVILRLFLIACRTNMNGFGWLIVAPSVELGWRDLPFKQNINPVLVVTSLDHALVDFVNGKYVRTAHRKYVEKSFVFEKTIELHAGVDHIVRGHDSWIPSVQCSFRFHFT